MSEPQNSSSAAGRCPQCGAELPGNLPPELCPKCLLKTGLGTQPQGGPKGTIIISPESLAPGLPQLGEQLGHYRIVRPLGSGGMGTVFEAEDLENGRRVALKLLSHKLDSPSSRQRFFREGRLAGSINHPNSIYVFGTEEIGGTPVITMELVAGGTLEERVRASGPMRPAEAVDAVLQIIAGLEAAQRTGILHRDVKPSNCFVDGDGTVKIGDFGLSISTAMRMDTSLTAAGSFLGTPAFCSPEQLRGEELNARSDIYSVGATLFYLLAGRAPFQAKSDMALFATILEQTAPSPRQFRPELPRGLARAVRRCLEKQPGERFNNYEELRKALTPYGSTAPVPAALGLRFVAGSLDLIFVSLAGMVISMVGASLETHTAFSLFNFADLASNDSRQARILAAGIVAGWMLYFAVLEGIWGVTLGKLVCGLRVVGRDNNPPGFLRALPRPLICVLVPYLPEYLAYGINPTVDTYAGISDLLQLLANIFFFLLLAAVFSTARRRNGYAGIHDLATKTRVVSRTTLLGRPVPSVGDASPPSIEAKPLIGPYHVLDTLEDSSGTAWLLGYDLRLLRKVWIRTVSAGTPPVPAPLRNLGRVGRLRWLAGRRSLEENWDAFEALNGQPLLILLQNPQPWTQVRYWLSDVATELSAAQKDGTLPPLLALERVWITGDGRAKLLDFPAPGSPASTGGATAEAPRFLGQIAAAALEGRADAAAKPAGDVSVPLPLHVHQFFRSLPQMADANAFLLALRPLLPRLAVVTRRRRASMAAFCCAFPAFMACAFVLIVAFVEQWNRHNPVIFELRSILELRQGMQSRDKNQLPVPTDRDFAIYITSHFRAAITNSASWSNTVSLTLIDDEDRRFAQESVTRYPAPAADEIAGANVILKECQSGSALSWEDIKDLPALVDRLKRHTDPVSAFLWQGISSQDRAVLTNNQPSASGSVQARNVVFQAVNNKIIGETSIYEAERFNGVSLRPETAWLMKQSPTNRNLAGFNLHFLNRFLLEDAYPRELSQTQFTPAPFQIFDWGMPPISFMMNCVLLIFVCLPALIAAPAFRGGLVLLVTGVTFVRRDGTPASRLRVFWRACLTWSLLLAGATLFWYGSKWGWSDQWTWLALGLFYGLTVVSVALPERGLQDRLAGTWPVLR